MTLSATLVGFGIGALFGILLAVSIVHVRTLEKSLLPLVICSQMVPILAIAPIVIVVLGAIGLHGLLPKSIISAYLCFFPVTIGMVKGLNSPDPIQLDLMRTWSASTAQMFWKLRWPSSVPFLFASLKVAVTISLVGAIVAELPTGAQAGIGAPAADRLVLRADGADLGGAHCRRDHGRVPCRHHRRHRPFDRKTDGSGAMIWRWQAIGFLARGARPAGRARLAAVE